MKKTNGYSYTNLGVTSELYDAERLKGEVKTDEPTLDDYERLAQSKERFVISFDAVDKEGVLDTHQYNGIVIRMLPDENTETTSLERTRAMLRNYEVVVTDVNRATNCVTVSYADVREMQKRQVMRKLKFLLNEQKTKLDEVSRKAGEEVKRQMREELNSVVSGMKPVTARHFEKQKIKEVTVEKYAEKGGNFIVVPAVVKYIDRDMAYIDILGYKIPARIEKHNYAYTAITDFRKMLRVGDIIDVAVLSYGPDVKDPKTRVYYCSRLPLINNPWPAFPYKEGDKIKVTATDIRTGHWYGLIKGLDVQVFCEFSEYANVRIILGHTYNCTIYKINTETYLVRARTYSEVTDRRKD